jgi:hypothetical protein
MFPVIALLFPSHNVKVRVLFALRPGSCPMQANSRFRMSINKKDRVLPGLLIGWTQAYAACTGIAWRVSMMRLSASTYTSSGA